MVWRFWGFKVIWARPRSPWSCSRIIGKELEIMEWTSSGFEVIWARPCSPSFVLETSRKDMMTTWHQRFTQPGPLWGNPMETSGFPSQWTSNAMLYFISCWTGQASEKSGSDSGDSRRHYVHCNGFRVMEWHVGFSASHKILQDNCSNRWSWW